MNFVKYEEKGQIGIITLERPSALNALNSEVISDVGKVIEGIDLCAVRSLIITGSGKKSFVAGADIGEMSGLDPQGAAAFGAEGNRVFRMIETLPIPVIAAVNGFALGGGCELALCCDIRICSENASFGQPESGLGITPGFGGTQRLPRTIGVSKAKELIYTARRIKAAEALECGLVSAIYPQAELMDKAMAMCRSICQNVPCAVRKCKEAINKGLNCAMDEAIAVEVECFSACFTTEDREEAMRAFLEKRKPNPFQNK